MSQFEQLDYKNKSLLFNSGNKHGGFNNETVNGSKSKPATGMNTPISYLEMSIKPKQRSVDRESAIKSNKSRASHAKELNIKQLINNKNNIDSKGVL